MGKIMMNGIQYGVGGITDSSDVKYSDSQSVKDAIDTISSNIGGFVFKGLSLEGGANRTYAATGGTRIILFSTGTNTNIQGIIFLAINSGNTSMVQSKLSENSNFAITCSLSDGNLTITNTSTNYATIRFILVSGSLT